MNRDNTVFKIKNLSCQYIMEAPVLEINQLDIPGGQLVFLIGKSGIGKSTLIETLGLMNKTLALRPDTSIQFFPDNGQSYELSDSWRLPNQQLSDFRKNHFSFIFQNTNLMPNFTCGENMMVSLLIAGRKIPEAKREVLSVMDKLSLSRDIFDKKITEVSGGQRQRLAFVRAVTANFTVLFGDEPTGNLDEHTAEELMAVLKELAIKNGKTGIIVSHDLDLAEKFADLIVPITAKKRQGELLCGEVIPDNIIRRRENSWVNSHGPITRIGPFLNRFLSSASELMRD